MLGEVVKKRVFDLLVTFAGNYRQLQSVARFMTQEETAEELHGVVME